MRTITRFGRVLTILAAIFALGLSACSSTTPDASASGGTALVDSYQDATSVRNQLLLGTIKLEGTANAVTAEQARQLLPLWEGYKGLTTSGSAAQQELDAVLGQIQKAMSASQVAAISGMKLTTANLNAYYAEIGLPQSTPQPGATPGAGSTLSAEEKAARRAASGETTTSSGSSRGTALLDNVVKLMKERAAQ